MTSPRVRHTTSVCKVTYCDRNRLSRGAYHRPLRGPRDSQGDDLARGRTATNGHAWIYLRPESRLLAKRASRRIAVFGARGTGLRAGPGGSTTKESTSGHVYPRWARRRVDFGCMRFARTSFMYVTDLGRDEQMARSSERAKRSGACDRAESGRLDLASDR